MHESPTALTIDRTGLELQLEILYGYGSWGLSRVKSMLNSPVNAVNPTKTLPPKKGVSYTNQIGS